MIFYLEIRYLCTIFAVVSKQIDYGTESEQELEIVLLHQGSSGHVWAERKHFALLGNGVSVFEAKD
jgi:hypothetical protein